MDYAKKDSSPMLKNRSMLHKRLIICNLFLLLLLAGCSKPIRSDVTATAVYDKVDLTKDLKSCTVFADHIECQLNNGRIYYAQVSKINLITKWDCSAWKENPC